jgi:uncharacterized RDD family membrane protein YckC
MDPGTTPPQYAHPLRRLVAYVVDGIIVAALIFLVLTLVTLLLGPTVRFDDSSADGLAVDRGRALLNAILGVLIGAVYFIGSWVRSGRTVGGALFDLRVASADGERLLSVGGSVIRWVALGAPLVLVSPVVRGSPGLVTALTIVTVAWALLLLVTTILDKRHRGLHDRLARSVVVRASAPQRQSIGDIAS